MGGPTFAGTSFSTAASSSAGRSVFPPEPCGTVDTAGMAVGADGSVVVFAQSMRQGENGSHNYGLLKYGPDGGMLWWRALDGHGHSTDIPGGTRVRLRSGTRAISRGRKLSMGKFDRRKSTKMTRRKGQRKKKARLARRADAARAERTKKKPTKKRGSSS